MLLLPAPSIASLFVFIFKAEHGMQYTIHTGNVIKYLHLVIDDCFWIWLQYPEVTAAN
jgi:hypothetical protein